MSSEYQHIRYEVRAGVARITLSRPDRLNALGMGPGSSREEIAAALCRADRDDEVGTVLLRAEGRAFCAGGDLTGVPPTETPLDEHLFNEDILRFYAGFRALHKPVVAAVNGLCLGAGLGMLVQCDLVVAADDARFGLIEGRIGQPGASELVPVIGAQWAKFLILTGELIDAETAREIGLALAVVPADRLDARAADLAERIARLPRGGVTLNKACIDAMTDVMGRTAGRLVGRAIDTTTKGMGRFAQAPDGRTFEDILRAEGIEGMKKARDLQFKGAWLEPRARRSDA
ncbi:enoyl-CoA hydratase/isomerase family protein [Thauera sinica]|uniref:Enoyl-CoA hydratase/isomerase family protein n=1 Tax=Thauera sinica TaxID=2665146 RepID=A0ABW1AXU2_9RHOO|nr:enoyl-CoA hydratase/isomerase family protein [Thauera sp. K11]ATE58758.1 enoyl-CoA hydratase [Thauera sp. K11]